MASPQEIQTPPSAAIDPQHFQQFQTNDGHTAFNSMMPSSHLDAGLSSGSASHEHAVMTSMFQPELDHSHALPVPMQMSLSSIPQHRTDLSNMEAVSAVSLEAATTQGMLSDFAPQNGSFGIDYRINNLDGLEGSHQLASSPSATTASTNPSHASSPAMNGMASTYSVGSSSLASALDGMAASRSRSDSSASPPNLLSSSSDLGFSSGGSGPPTSAHENGFPYTLQHENTSPAKEPSPEQPGSAHLLVLGDMLKK